jgi:hypothetical protein
MSGSQALDTNMSYRLANYYHWMFNHNNAVQMIKDYRDYTFIFEGIFPDDVHVVQYNEQMFGLHLLGMRQVEDGVELPYKDVVEVAEKYDVPHVKIFDMTFEEAYQDVLNDGRKANEGEGYVIDVDSQKYKFKYDSYIQIHRAIGKLVSPNSIIAAIRDGYWDDFYSKIPFAYQEQARGISQDVFNYIKIMQKQVDKWYDIVMDNCKSLDKKTFMIAVTDIVPIRYQGFVRAKFLNQQIDFLHNVKYTKIKDFLDIMATINFNEINSKR